MIYFSDDFCGNPFDCGNTGVPSAQQHTADRNTSGNNDNATG
jgi:hypothetical protein